MSAEKTVLVQVNSLALGGTQINAVDLARAVARHGYRSILYGPLDSLPASGADLREVAAARGVELHGFRPPATVASGAARELRERADAIGADLVHLYGTWGGARNAYWGPCRFGRLPFVQTAYETVVDPSVYRHNSLIVGTGYHRDELAGRPGPTSFISPPVDLAADSPDPGLAAPFRDQLGALGDRPLIVIVSRLDQYLKGFAVETGVRAMEHLADTDAALVVVGTGTEEPRLRALGDEINRRAGREMVRFIGAMHDPRPAYAAADIALGMGNSAARSLAFETPVVVHGEWGTTEVFGPENAESLFHRNFWNPDVQEHAAQVQASVLRSLIDAPARRERLGRFGRAFAAENFGLDAMARRLAGVYDQALKSYRLRAWVGDLGGELPKLAALVGRRARWRPQAAATADTEVLRAGSLGRSA
ncbi:glycosyltransferase family 4 protein [Microbacterium sp. 18062]|uniref:glycosyltransferase family 4 protein n=1 Tax=Microbacterium sp. 18062 TaxID=2681410 RepID=UPI0013597234|nr:glycosyltransferase family 4 protein [Microbacterium sp. 18062]